MSKAVKIKYYYDFVSPSEIFGFTVGTITLLGAMAIIIASAFSPWSASGITGCISLVITSVMMIGWAFSEQTWRRKMAAKNREKQKLKNHKSRRRNYLICRIWPNI